jgi:superfamily II DNA or RNA helicase/HKD family nuclease
MSLSPGLYDALVTDSLRGRLSADAVLQDLPSREAADRLAGELSRQLSRLLVLLSDGADGSVRAQLDLTNGLLQHLRSLHPSAAEVIDPVVEPGRLLRSIPRPAAAPPEHPETGLAFPWLFTAGKGSPALLNELRRESAAADGIDILVSFITMTGIRRLFDVLSRVTADGSTTVRVLTTTYTGATELSALEALAMLRNCTVRISLDGRRTRLHAKSWLFRRQSGFGSAYVGSANFTGAALMGGLEWTVKFTQRGQHELFDRACAEFDSLWADSEFTAFDPGDEACVAAVRAALRREGGESSAAILHYFDIQPKQYQREILDDLQYEREQGRHRNLVVAATGTGKTVIAALDYRRISDQLGYRPPLLFVAHRAQILRQAMRTYREVLRDHSFGELLTGGLQPMSHAHLFASINSLTSRDLVSRLGPDYWHVVVIDECHRIAARQFDAFATGVEPVELLGLTATPERTDGQSIANYFSPRPDGAPAAELRLWHALDLELLSPFEYYGCDDDTDFSDVPWGTAAETGVLDLRVRANVSRARQVVHEWTRLAGDPRRSRALVFCVSVAHAEFVTRFLIEAGIPAQCVTGETHQAERLRAPHRLENGDVNALVTVDLYNEGVDLPSVDTLVLLRPTQSPVLFQQQIGRGLRLAPGKTSCLILDFVGQHRAEFRFDRLFGGITGLGRRELVEGFRHGFSSLPAGCHIHLEPRTREQVLRNLQTLLNHRWASLKAEVAAFAATRAGRSFTLGQFVHEQGVSPDEIYRSHGSSGWTTLKREAGLIRDEPSSSEADLSRRMRMLLHTDDPDQLSVYDRIAASPLGFTPEAPADATRAQMLAYQLEGGRAYHFRETLQRFAANPACAAELGELAELLRTRSRTERQAIPGLEDVPLGLHAAYQRREILTALGVATPTSWHMPREGVLRIPDRHLEVLFVTLDKSAGFHDRIAYHDYAVSPTRFHWQTQNAAGPDTPAGRRYIAHVGGGEWTFHLFVRGTPDAPFRACGPGRILALEDIEGDRPMNITWSLDVPLPARLFSEFSVLRGG